MSISLPSYPLNLLNVLISHHVDLNFESSHTNLSGRELFLRLSRKCTNREQSNISCSESVKMSTVVSDYYYLVI